MAEANKRESIESSDIQKLHWSEVFVSEVIIYNHNVGKNDKMFMALENIEIITHTMFSKASFRGWSGRRCETH